MYDKEKFRNYSKWRHNDSGAEWQMIIYLPYAHKETQNFKKSPFFVGAAFPALSSSKGSRDKPPVIPESVAGGLGRDDELRHSVLRGEGACSILMAPFLGDL